MDAPEPVSHKCRVLTKIEFLDRVLSLAKSQAEISEVLGLPPPRISDLYLYRFPARPAAEDEKPKKPRDLKYEEARALADKYDIDLQPERQTSRPSMLSESELADLIFAVLSKQAFGETPLRELARTLAHSVRNSPLLSRTEQTKDRIRAQKVQAESQAASPPPAASKTARQPKRRTQRDKGGSRART